MLTMNTENSQIIESDLNNPVYEITNNNLVCRQVNSSVCGVVCLLI
jgi:hypothetical protein